MIGKLDVVEFSRLFTGNKRSYGCHVYDPPNEKGEKRSGQSFTKKEPLMERQYADHLNGKQGLGVVPVNERSKCKFAVIDIDEYKVSFQKYLVIKEEYDLPLCFFRSKSGGLHMYVFFDEEYPAKQVIDAMKKILTVLGLKDDTEIFPKQSKLNKDGTGNWINLPYHNADKPTQYLYDQNQKAYSLTEALQEIKNSIVTIQELNDTMSSIPFADAPPCLQSLYLLNNFTKDSGNRNDFSFNVASYLKNKYAEDFPDKLREVNARFPDPLPDNELEKTIILSHQRKTYSYNCKHPVLAAVCNKTLCKTRQYGIDSLEAPNVDYGQLTQYQGLSTRYEWEINNKILKFDNEEDILSQKTFLKLCIRELKEFPFRLSLPRWDRVIREAVEEMDIKKDTNEFSEEILFHDYLLRFLTEGAKARSPEQIGLHRVYDDPETECFVFKRVDLIDFLDRKHFYRLKTKDIKEILLRLGGREKQFYLQPGKQVRVWMIPMKNIHTQTQIMDEPDDKLLEDFTEFQDEGENEY